MNDLYEVLEICLQEIEQGADIDSVLFRYPAYAGELRPILEAAVDAKNLAAPAPSADVVRRNRARVLQQAARLRESKVKSSQRIWFASLRRVAVTLVVVAALFISGTNLVRAASTTLPGDNLYPVKRTWEDVLLLFTFDLQQRDALEIEHENERLHELRELFAEGRAAEVDFAGLVSSQAGNQWIVSGIPVVISSQTEIRDGTAIVGSAVRVKGHTQGDGVVLAERIRLLPPGSKLPDLENEKESAGENDESSEPHPEDSPGKGSGEDEPNASETESTEPGRKDQSLEGTVTSIGNDEMIVNGVEMDLSNAEIKGTPGVGATVKVEGYYDSNGVFVVTKVEYKDSGSGSDGGSGSDSDSNDGNSTPDDHSGGNDDSNSNGGDDSGGGGNSGSGGGGGDD